jgi:hypothetical protein
MGKNVYRKICGKLKELHPDSTAISDAHLKEAIIHLILKNDQLQKALSETFAKPLEKYQREIIPRAVASQKNIILSEKEQHQMYRCIRHEEDVDETEECVKAIIERMQVEIKKIPAKKKKEFNDLLAIMSAKYQHLLPKESIFRLTLVVFAQKQTSNLKAFSKNKDLMIVNGDAFEKTMEKIEKSNPLDMKLISDASSLVHGDKNRETRLKNQIFKLIEQGKIKLKDCAHLVQRLHFSDLEMERIVKLAGNLDKKDLLYMIVVSFGKQASYEAEERDPVLIKFEQKLCSLLSRKALEFLDEKIKNGTAAGQTPSELLRIFKRDFEYILELSEPDENMYKIFEKISLLLKAQQKNYSPEKYAAEVESLLAEVSKCGAEIYTEAQLYEKFQSLYFSYLDQILENPHKDTMHLILKNTWRFLAIDKTESIEITKLKLKAYNKYWPRLKQIADANSYFKEKSNEFRGNILFSSQFDIPNRLKDFSEENLSVFLEPLLQAVQEKPSAELYRLVNFCKRVPEKNKIQVLNYIATRYPNLKQMLDKALAAETARLEIEKNKPDFLEEEKEQYNRKYKKTIDFFQKYIPDKKIVVNYFALESQYQHTPQGGEIDLLNSDVKNEASGQVILVHELCHWLSINLAALNEDPTMVTTDTWGVLFNEVGSLARADVHFWEIFDESNYSASGQFDGPRIGHPYDNAMEFSASAMTVFLLHPEQLLEQIQKIKHPDQKRAAIQVWCHLRDNVFKAQFLPAGVRDPFAAQSICP